MNEMIEQYEEILKQIESRIYSLKHQLEKPIGAKAHDIICARISLLEKESEELIQNIHKMKTR